MIQAEFLTFQVEQGIGKLVLNRPPVNALNKQLIQELHQAADQLRQAILAGKADLRTIILAAEGKHFCAGADLKERRGLRQDQVEGAVNATRAMVDALARLPVPLIAAIHGIAVGGGMELTLAADIRVMGESARMGLRETALAIIPGAGGTQRLPRLIGAAAATYWITTARLFNAADCLRFGVATEVVPDDKVLYAAFDIANDIAANGPLAVRAAKEAIISGLEGSLAGGMEVERQGYAKIIPTQDRLEALAAFDEKRKPIFKGK